MKRTGSEKILNKGRTVLLLLPVFLLCGCLLCACGANGKGGESRAPSNAGAVSERDKSEADGGISSGETAAQTPPSSGGGETVTQTPGGASSATAAPSGGGETAAPKAQETAPAAQTPQTPQTPQAPAPEPEAKKELTLSVNGQVLSVNWEENESVAALEGLVKEGPLTIAMSMYGGFEQVGSLRTSLPRNDSQTTTSAGDIVLYSGNQLVIFYGYNSWAYTRLGKITGKTAAELKDLLGNGNVTVILAQS